MRFCRKSSLLKSAFIGCLSLLATQSSWANNMTVRLIANTNGLLPSDWAWAINSVIDNGRWHFRGTNYVSGATAVFSADGLQAITFNNVTDFYKPDDVVTNIEDVDHRFLTNYYTPYTNYLSITVRDQWTNALPAAWSIRAYPSEFTNASGFFSSGVGNHAAVRAPTGTYTIAFSNYVGYTNRTSVSNITVPTLHATFTSVYERVLGNIRITNLWPTNATVRFLPMDSAADYSLYTTSLLTQTNNGTITNAPIGAYQVSYDSIPNFQPPPSFVTNIVGSDTNVVNVVTGWYSPAQTYALTVRYQQTNVFDPLPAATWRVRYVDGSGNLITLPDTASGTASGTTNYVPTNALARVELPIIAGYTSDYSAAGNFFLLQSNMSVSLVSSTILYYATGLTTNTSKLTIVMKASDGNIDLVHANQIAVYSRWGQLSDALPSRVSGTFIDVPSGSPVGILFTNLISGFSYVPSTNITITNDTVFTNLYYPHSNRFIVTGVPTNAPWALTVSNNYFGSYLFSNGIGNVTGICPTGLLTLVYGNVMDKYTPPSSNVAISGVTVANFTNIYRPYSNSAAISIQGVSLPTNVYWSLTGPDPQFQSFCSAYKSVYTNVINPLDPSSRTNTLNSKLIPTGTYIIAYQPLDGYNTPTNNPFTNTIAGNTNLQFTGVYTRITGHVHITMDPTNAATSNAPWTLITYPSDYTNALSGTGPMWLSNSPIGSYAVEFGSIIDYITATNQAGVLNQYTPLTLNGRYVRTNAYALTVNVESSDPSFTDGLGDARWNHTATSTWASAWLDSGTIFLPTNMVRTNFVVKFKPVAGYGTPASISIANMSASTTLVATYRPWTNFISITVDPQRAPWTLSQANGTFETTNGTGDRINEQRVRCPTGTYTIVFGGLSGYVLPSPSVLTTNIVGANNADLSGIYSQAVCQITVNAHFAADGSPVPSFVFNLSSSNSVIPSNNQLLGPWISPATQATGSYAVAFNSFVQSGVTYIASDLIRDMPNGSSYTFDGAYSPLIPPVPDVNVVVYPPPSMLLSWDGRSNVFLNGVGTGTFAQTQNPGTSTNTVSLQITAIPVASACVSGDTNVYHSVFYKYFVDYNNNGFDSTEHFVWKDENNPEYPYRDYSMRAREIDKVGSQTFTVEVFLNVPVTVYLLFSREYFTYDNVGDLDHDLLPDYWELVWGMDPENARGTNGPSGNVDNDYLPSSVTNVVTAVTLSSNYSTTYAGATALTGSGYPLQPPLILGGYSSNIVPFNNLLECRGFDGYYMTNVPAGGPNYGNSLGMGDDPMTSPVGGDAALSPYELSSEGWRYYFWYWRSSNSFVAGVTQSFGLGWVKIAPSFIRNPLASDPGVDTDNDGILDIYEYSFGTDPTHADTDGDGMDDVYELKVWGSGQHLNPLDRTDGAMNPDNDAYAVINGSSVMEAGMNGTLFPEMSVYYLGRTNNLTAVWADNTNAGGTLGVFNLYRDFPILTPSAGLSNGAVGTLFVENVYYGTSAGLPYYQYGYPVWVDMDWDAKFSAGDLEIVKIPRRHADVYKVAPTNAYPGQSSFSPLSGWFLEGQVGTLKPINTRPFMNILEYQGPRYVGEAYWDAAGLLISHHDAIPIYTDPFGQDTDNDLIPDGWEMYVGMDPVDSLDAALDSDSDELSNQQEWMNLSYTNIASAMGTNSWAAKLYPTDPGVITAPAPNDPHPQDTDFDGLTDGEEMANGTSPTSSDTDSDFLPDGWEVYAGADPLRNDAREDPDGDGLLNYQEYWTTTVPEWNGFDASWAMAFAIRESFNCNGDLALGPNSQPFVYVAPSWTYDPVWYYTNGLMTDLATLRAIFPASQVISLMMPLTGAYADYHSCLANEADSDGDGMDDYWEVYHGLNPLNGTFTLLMPGTFRYVDYGPRQVGGVDADPIQAGMQFGYKVGNNASVVFYNVTDYLNYIIAGGSILAMVGPQNLGLELMDPDGDGLPNLEEYSYSFDVFSHTRYHSDPTPLARTDVYASDSFVNRNYTYDLLGNYVFSPRGGVPFFQIGWTNDPYANYPFPFEMNEGFDSDNDGVGDYAEVNNSSGEVGANPMNSRDPIRNRALKLNGSSDFIRTLCGWHTTYERTLVNFTVEAWIKPDVPVKSGNQIVVEKSGLYGNPYDLVNAIVRANFRLGMTNGLPYVMYNGRGARTTFQATASVAHRIQKNEWVHVAGTYDGTNLTLYVNGEQSASTRTTEVPATGWHPLSSSVVNNSLMIGARDDMPGVDVFMSPSHPFILQPADHFAGYIDEVRTWDGTRTRGDIIKDKGRRIEWSEMIANASNASLVYLTQLTNGTSARVVPTLFTYHTFDDVPDPTRAGEFIVPKGLNTLDTQFLFHPTLTWWRDFPLHSTVYTGSPEMPFNYLVSAEDHVSHLPLPLASDDYLHYRIVSNSPTDVITNYPSDYKNLYNPYNDLTQFGGLPILRDMYFFNGARVSATESWLDGLSPDPDYTDSDGDGLPDGWEMKFGLDPKDATGENGAWGDFDHDGLNNRSEYLAGTDPRKSDSLGTGVGDYDSRSASNKFSRSWGEMYDDGDGMPDDWEIANGLDPLHDDAHLDKDGDGWSNYQEYMADTDPSDVASHPNPSLGGSLVYDGRRTNGSLYVIAFQTNTMDGNPVIGRVGSGGGGISAADVITQKAAAGVKKYSGQLAHANIKKGTVRVSRWNPLYLTPTYDFVDDENGNWLYFGFFTGSGDDAKAWVTFDYLTGTYSFEWPTGGPNVLDAPWANDSIVISYEWQEAGANAFTVTGLKEGSVFLAAFRDVNNNRIWDAAEPGGLLDKQSVQLNWRSPSYSSDIGLMDEKPGYGRFGWATVNNIALINYDVKINMISLANSPAILASTIRWPRNYFNEWDYQRFGYYGLPTGQYQWWVGGAYGTNGTFSVTWPASQSQPSLVYPRGDVLTIARNSMKWSMDYYATQYHLQVVRNTGQVMVDRYYPAPYRNGSGVYQAVMPAYASEWGSGIYYWRVAGWNPTSESEWSDYQTFQIDLSSKNSRWISGDIYYFGKVPTTNVIVEAFENSAFSGDPASRIVLSFSASGGGDLGSYVLQGLQQKIYYVRAYIGLNTAGDETIQVAPHYWSSQGFVKDTVNAYKPGLVDLTSDIFASQKSVVIRDRDSDNDTLPDAWEINYFGNMDQTGDMDYDGDGQSNLQEYINDGLNLNPSAWDSDHDGLSDSFEMAYNGSAFGFRSRGASGQVLNPTVWDTDGDGYSDGAEIFRYHTDPLDPNRFPRYRPLCFGSSPSVADYDGDGRSDLSLFDTAIGNWHLYTMAGQSGVIRYGSSAMQPLVGDFDGDGRCELSLYYPFSGGWYSLNPWTGQSTASSFGDATMIPVPADYDGDRVADTAVYCPSSGYWFINASKGGIFSLPFGGPSLIPVPGDYSGDGACDLGVYDPATGTLALYLWNIYTRQGQLVRAHLGGPTMTPLACDMDGDGRADIIFFDNATGVWYVYTWTGQQISGQFGWSGCVPVPGDYDGDGRADAAIYYPPTGMWYVYTWVGQFYQGRFGGPDLAPALKGR